MASRPYFPLPRARTSNVPIVSKVTGGPTIPASKLGTLVNATPQVFVTNQLANVSNYNVSAIFSAGVTVACPAITTLTPVTVSAKVGLTTFPGTFKINPGCTGLVLVSSTLSPTNTLGSTVLVSNLSAAFSYGANSVPSFGILSPGILYTQPTISVILTVASLSGSYGAFSVEIIVQAALLGAVQ